jgi:hypothetical protein
MNARNQVTTEPPSLRGGGDQHPSRIGDMEMGKPIVPGPRKGHEPAVHALEQKATRPVHMGKPDGAEAHAGPDRDAAERPLRPELRAPVVEHGRRSRPFVDGRALIAVHEGAAAEHELPDSGLGCSLHQGDGPIYDAGLETPVLLERGPGREMDHGIDTVDCWARLAGRERSPWIRWASRFARCGPRPASDAAPSSAAGCRR